MAETVLKTAYIRFGTSGALQNISDHCRSVTIAYDVETHDRTAFGSSARKFSPGLKVGSYSIEINQDFATGGGSSSIDNLMYKFLGSSSGFIWIQPTTAVVAADNPRYYGNVLIASYSPLSGAAGDLSITSIELPANGMPKRSATAT